MEGMNEDGVSIEVSPTLFILKMYSVVHRLQGE